MFPVFPGLYAVVQAVLFYCHFLLLNPVRILQTRQWTHNLRTGHSGLLGNPRWQMNPPVSSVVRGQAEEVQQISNCGLTSPSFNTKSRHSPGPWQGLYACWMNESSPLLPVLLILPKVTRHVTEYRINASEQKKERHHHLCGKPKTLELSL